MLNSAENVENADFDTEIVSRDVRSFQAQLNGACLISLAKEIKYILGRAHTHTQSLLC